MTKLPESIDTPTRDKPHYFMWKGMWWRVSYNGAAATMLDATPWSARDITRPHEYWDGRLAWAKGEGTGFGRD